MLPLASAELPKSAQELRQAILGGLGRHGIVAREVVVEAAHFPEVERLSIDLTKAKVTREAPIPKARPSGSREIRVERLELRADPLFLEEMPARLQLSAKSAVFIEGRDAQGDTLLILQSATDGHLQIDASVAELQRLVDTLAKEAAAKQGVEILQIHIDLTSRGPRALSFRGEVVAKMFFKVEIAFSGDLDVDERLELRISNLTSSGSGMAASLAANFLRPHFTRLEAKPIPLSALHLGGVEPKDVEVTMGDRLVIRAQFGS